MIFKNLQKRVGILVGYYLFFISFLLTIYITNLYGWLFFYIFIFVLLIWVNFLIWYSNFWKLPLFFIIGSLLGFLISINNLNSINSNYEILNKYSGNFNNKTLIIGEITESYKQNDIINTYILKLKKINSQNIDGNINILINTNPKIIFKKGDYIEFNSEISKISNFNEFEYDKYLQLKDIYGSSNIYQFIKKGNNLNYFEKIIYNFKYQILQIIKNIYPGDSSKLLAGIFLGVRGDYSAELKNGFNNSGLSHIVAVSGYNITILLIFFGLIFKGLPGILKNILIITAVIFFLLLIGDNISAMRAGIMGIIGYLCSQYGRKVNIYSLLFFIAGIFVTINPLIINYDVGFYLTFLALMGLIIFQEKLSKIFYFLPAKFQIRESISTTLSVLIFTIPIMLTSFEKISIISPISNLLILPIIPITMLLGFISVIGYLISIKIGFYIGYITYLCLKFILYVADIFGNSTFSTINYDLGDYKGLFIIFYYLIILFIIFYFKSSQDNTKKIS